jgi:hypothetical protein
VEGGAFQSKKLAKASQDFIFVWQHQTAADSCDSYRLVTEEFLPKDFLHPAYFFLRPDGTEVSKENRHHHEAISAQLILRILEETQKEWGKPLSGKDYEKAKAELAEAEAHYFASRADEARAVLEKLSRRRERCGVKERARTMLRDLEVRDRLLEAFRAEVPGDDPPEDLRRPEEMIRRGRLDALYRWLGARDDGLSKALLPKVVEALRESIRLKPLKMDRVFLDDKSLYYLKAEWETDLAQISALVMQIGYVTDKKETFEGWAVYDEVRPSTHHRAATSLSSRDLRLADLVNARVQLWLDGLLLHESRLKPEATEFPEQAGNVIIGPDLLGPDETLNSGAQANMRTYQVGRYPGRVP